MFTSLRFLLTALAAGLLSSLCAQQSLFDKAIALDSIYDLVRAGEDRQSREFFAQLRDMYEGGERLSDEAIYEDIAATNIYLRPKLNLVFSKLEATQADEVAGVEVLQARIDSLYELAIVTAEAACRANNDDPSTELDSICGYGIYIDILKEYQTNRQLALLRKKAAAENPELSAYLRTLENRAYELAAQMDEEQVSDEAVLRLSGRAGSGLPFSNTATVNDQAFSPIVVQQAAGGGSLQANVIDGASKWIAERMREELSIAFFDRFEIWMEDQEMHTLFPHTFRALDASVTTDYSLMIEVMKSAFHQDLDGLPFRIGTFVRSELGTRAAVNAQEKELHTTFLQFRQARNQWVGRKEMGIDFMDAFDQLVLADSLEIIYQNRRRQFQRNDVILNYLSLTIAATEELSKGRHPSNLLSVLNERSDEFFPQGGDVRPALLVLEVLSRSLIRVDEKNNTVWLKRENLLQLTRDAQLRNIYFGLIHQEIRHALRRRRSGLESRRAALLGLPPETVFGTGAHEEPVPVELLNDPEFLQVELALDRLNREQRFVDTIILKDPQRMGKIINDFSLFATQIDNIQHQFANLRRQDKANLGSPELIYLMKNSLEVVHQLFTVALPDQPGTLDTIRQLSDNILDAYSAVLAQDYDAVVMNVVPIAGTLLDIDYRNRVKRAGLIDESVREEMIISYGERQRKLQEVFRYGAFLAAVAESRDADDIKQAIRAIALPTGSYSIKRRSFGNISLNTYPGLTGGMELLSADGRRAWAPNFGFTAPIGLAFSWGYSSGIDQVKYVESDRYRRRVDRSLPMRNNRFLTGHSGSLFFPLIDLGAVVLFRLDSSTESLPEDVGFQQLFSPGIQYAHGFPNLPISVLAGVQVSPRLRKFGEERADAFRFNFGITVDLPMANFHTRSAERKK